MKRCIFCAQAAAVSDSGFTNGKVFTSILGQSLAKAVANDTRSHPLIMDLISLGAGLFNY